MLLTLFSKVIQLQLITIIIISLLSLSIYICVCVLVSQSCPTLCDPMDCSLPGSSVHGIFRARILEWVAISFSKGSSLPKDRTQVSCTASRFFTIWATREAHGTRYFLPYYVSHFQMGKQRLKEKIVRGKLQGWEQTQVHLGPVFHRSAVLHRLSLQMFRWAASIFCLNMERF